MGNVHLNRFLILLFAGAKVSDTIRKGIVDISPYENNTELLMVGNVAALSGEDLSALSSLSPPLPPANGVWGKVMFSQVFVCLRGGGLHPTRGGGVCLGGCAYPLGTRKAGGAHPTGMLSCCRNYYHRHCCHHYGHFLNSTVSLFNYQTDDF